MRICAENVRTNVCIVFLPYCQTMRVLLRKEDVDKNQLLSRETNPQTWWQWKASDLTLEGQVCRFVCCLLHVKTCHCHAILRLFYNQNLAAGLD